MSEKAVKGKGMKVSNYINKKDYITLCFTYVSGQLKKIFEQFHTLCFGKTDPLLRSVDLLLCHKLWPDDPQPWSGDPAIVLRPAVVLRLLKPQQGRKTIGRPDQS